jgi:molybdate transport system permease protein
MPDSQRSAKAARLPSPGSLFAVLAAVLLAFFVLPIFGMALRLPWSTAFAEISKPQLLEAIIISLFVSFSAVASAVLFGFPLAWLLARASFPGRRFLRTLVLLPMVFPPVVGGLALFTIFGRNGLLGPVLNSLGIQVAFTPAASILAATFVSAPFFVLSAETGLSSTDRRIEEAAATLGASTWRILGTVILPAIRPSLLAGVALTWARALGEFGATIMFAGNVEGRTQTVPLAIYDLFQMGNHDGAILLSLILVVISFVLLLLLHGKAFGR